MRAFLISMRRGRLLGRLWPIFQTAVAAVLAWYLAVVVGAEQRPAFAAIAAVISLGATFGERRQRAVQLIAGVMLGILVADLLVRLLGSGLPQIGVLVLLAMVAAVALGGGELLVTEAAVSAILIASLPHSAAAVRMLEVLIGGGVALSVQSFVFPPDPVLSVARATNAVFGELGTTLKDAADALADGDQRRAEAAVDSAQQVEVRVGELREVLLLGADTARWAPQRRAARSQLDGYERMLRHATLAAGNTRVLMRHVLRYVRGGRPPQPELADALRDLSLAAWELPAQFTEPWRGGDVLKMAFQAASSATAAVRGEPDVALLEIAGHARSIAIDLVKASEAGESERGAIGEAPTEELLASMTAPEPA